MNPTLFLIVITTVLAKFFILGEDIESGILLTNTLDFSWQSDSIERYLHGFIAGRDFIFTYGPLSQFIFSLPAIIFNQKSYIAVLYYPIILTIINTLLIFIISKQILLNNKTAFILTLYLIFVIGLISYDANNLIRMLLPFAFGILAFKAMNYKNIYHPLNILIFCLPSIFGLYTYDIFIICTISTLLLFLIQAIKTPHFLIYISYKCFIAILLILVSQIITSFILTGNLNYIIYSLDTVSNYQYVENIPLSISSYYIYLIYPAALISSLFYLFKFTKFNSRTKNIIFVISFIALLQLKSAFIRSDDSHIIMGAYPSLIIFFIIIFLLLRNKFNWKLLSIFIIFYILIPYKSNPFDYKEYRDINLSLELLTSDKSFFDIYKIPKNFPYSTIDFSLFKELINKNQNKVMIYPYDTYILNLYGNTFNSLPLQYYQYSNSYVEKDEVNLLIKNSPKYIILGVDTKGAVMLDNIPNFSRNPLIAKWMIENYSVYKKSENYLILQKGKKFSKKSSSINKDCPVYEIDVSNIMKTNMLEKFTKTSTFYLRDYDTRLPYTADTKQILIIEDNKNADKLEDLFNDNISFKKHTKAIKKLKIIKKYPLPIFKEEFEKEFKIKCFDSVK